jgi:hypothetical protein
LNFLNIYPNSTKRNEVLVKIENFRWKECDSLKTKTAYENFIKEYPNSTKVRTAKIALENLVEEFNLEEINSYTSVSVGKNIFRPFTFISGKKVFPEMSITEISHNGKMAIGIGTKDSRIKNMTNNIANIIDLTDGKILFEYKYDEFSRYLFSDDDSKLYFYENKSVKSLDLKNFEIKTIFKIDIGFFDRANLYLSDNILHLTTMRNDYKEPVIHFSYNLNANKLDTETFYLPEYDGAGIETLKQFNSYLGTTEEKLLKLKLIQGDNIFIKPINKNSKNEYIVFRYPQLLIIKNGIITTNTNIQIYTTDKFTKEIKELNFFRRPYSFLSENNKIILSGSDRPNNKGFYILELGTKNGQIINSSVKTKFVDPIKFNASFIGINEKTDKIYFDIDIDSGCDYDNDFEINVQDYNDITNNDLLKENTHKILSKNDKKLSEFLSSYINETNVRNMPIETDNEKYLRIKDLYVNNLPSFIKLQDSLTQNLNTILTDSIRTFDFKATDVFIASNYDLSNENWRLIFNNPYGGKNFSVIYNQSKLSAKKDLSNNFSDLKIQVKYYLNPLSFTYEPVLLTISNIQTNTQNKFIIPFKSLSLLKNLYLTDNSYVDNFMNSKYIDCRLERGDLTYDSDIIKYFVNNGKPKYYLNYGFNDYNRIVKVEGVSAFNLDDINFRYNLEKSENFESGYKFNSMGRGTNLKFNEIPYFINKSNQDGTAIFGTSSSSNSFEKNEFYTPGKFNYLKNWRISDEVIYSNEGKGILSDLININDFKNNKTVKQFNLIELGNLNLKDKGEKIDFDAVISPNGKYLAIRVNDMTFLYNTIDWKNIFKFKSNAGKLYWDCNSYFLGIGENVLPIQLIEKIGIK